MELFTGGQEAFPQYVAPFPDLTAMIEPAEDMMLGDHRMNLPPQKLRPIRYNGRSPASSQAEDPSEFVEAVEHVGDDVCAVNGDSFDYLVPPIKAEVGDVIGTVGCSGGGVEEPPCSEQRREPSGSSSGSDYDDLSATVNEPLKKKRKRKRRGKMEHTLEKLVKKMMDKQEQMHKQLVEMIEKRERERIIREEVWKQQEMERIKRDEEARAQEMSRSIALISFIQNALGHEIEIPVPSTMSSMEENGGKDMSKDHIQKDTSNPFGPTNNRWQEGTMQANVGENHVIDRDGGVNCDPNNRRWPDAEVQALIMLRSTLEHKFHVSGSKCSIWDEISVGMYGMGYSRSAKKCKEKWENINKYFRKSMVSGKKHKENSKRCTYFHDLHMLYKNGFSSQANHMNCTKVENTDSGESLKATQRETGRRSCCLPLPCRASRNCEYQMAEKLEEQLKGLGSKLESPPSAKDALLKLLKQAATCLSEIDQSPPSSIMESMQPLLNAIVKPELLKHQDREAKLLVATCICEITRITAPEAPYSDDILKDVFNLIVGTFNGLSDTSGPSFGRRVVILETLAKYRSCVVMLDLECDDLVNEMFSTFFSVVRDDHPENVISSMQTIMIVVLEESEDVRDDLLLVILSALDRNRSGVTQAARRLAMNVIEQCSEKLEAGIKQFLISVMSGDNQPVKIEIDYHEVIYGIYHCAPQILSGVVPYLTGELLTDQIDTRLRAVRLVGSLFALPGPIISEAFQPIFSEFLKRLTDRVVDVRMSVLEHVKSCLLSDPSRSEAPQIISALCDRLLDYDENVRKQVVDVICDVSCHSLVSVPVGTVKLVAERLRDKSLLVKKYTMERLAEIFKVYCAGCSDGSINHNEFDWIPGKIFRCFYDKDFRSDTIESVLCGSLFPTEFSIKDKVKCWIRVFSGFDKIEVKALERMLEQKQRLQQEMQRYLALRQRHQDSDSPEIQKKVLFSFQVMSRSFSDPVKAEENFQTLDRVKDANIWKILLNLLDPNTSFHQASSGRDELLKILAERHQLYDFLSMLSLKCSYLLFNKEHVREILLEATVQKSAENTLYIQSCMNILVILARFSPSLLGGAEEELINFLKDDNEIIKEGILHVLAKAGSTIREQLAVSSSSIDLILERLCLEGNRRQAKYAVHALAAITKDDGLKSLSVLYKSLVDMLEEKTHLPAVLQSLGCIAQTAMPVFETRESEIEEFIKSEILRCRNDADGSAKECWDEKSELCMLKVFGIKTLVRSYMPVKDAHLRPAIDSLLGLLRNILSFGEISEDIKSSLVDKAHLRLAAAKAVLRLSRYWDHKIPVDIFYLTLRAAEISFPQARKQFLSKVHQYIKDRLLDAKYACAFLISVPGSKDLQFDEQEKQNLADIFQMYQQAKVRQVSIQSDTSSSTSYPEYILPYLVHALAHHSCPNTDECKDVKAFELTYRKLYLTISLLVNKDEDAKSEAGANKEKESISLIFSIFKSIQHSEDVVDAIKSKNSHAICDLGLSIMRRLAYKEEDLQGLIQSVSLPPLLYKPYERKEGEDSPDGERQTWLADVSVLSHFDSLNLECDGTKEISKEEALKDSETERNEVPLRKMIKQLKSKDSKAGKAKKNKSPSVEAKDTENDVDILKMVREINLDSLQMSSKFESTNGHKHSSTKKEKVEQEHQKGNKRKINVAASVPVPKRKRSSSTHGAFKISRSASKVPSRDSGDDWHEVKDSSFKKWNENNESDYLVPSIRKKRSFSSKVKGKGSDWGHSDEDDEDEADDENLEKSDTSKSAAGSSKKQKKSIAGLAKCSTKEDGIDIADLIGYRIKVWWPLDKQFYEGTIKSYDPIKKKHVILYEDGDVEVLRLERERWELVVTGRKSGKKANSSKVTKGPKKEVSPGQKSKSSGGSRQKKSSVNTPKVKRTPKKNLKHIQKSMLKDDEEKAGVSESKSTASNDSPKMNPDESEGVDYNMADENRMDREESGKEVASVSQGRSSEDTKGSPNNAEESDEVKSDADGNHSGHIDSTSENAQKVDEEEKAADELSEDSREPATKETGSDHVESKSPVLKKSVEGPSLTSDVAEAGISDDEPLSKWKHKVGKSACDWAGYVNTNCLIYNLFCRVNSQVFSSSELKQMGELLGLLKVVVVQGKKLGIRDFIFKSSDPYVVVKLGDQVAKTKVINCCLNPVWNEELTFSLTEPVGVLNLEVFDKDRFKADDKMGHAYLNLQPLVSAARLSHALRVSSGEMALRKVVPDTDNCLVRESCISSINGEVVQRVRLRLCAVESGEIELKVRLIETSSR
ncbi:hypothetical protein V6N13_078711 [Hibiscus sabdariffa]